MTDSFRFNEKYLSQIPALQLLVNLGFTYLPPDEALAERGGRLANVLLSHGVRRGDTVCIYMPMIPEAVYAMLACARIGAVHTVVFGGFSAESLRDRILDAGARVLLTANQGLRGGRRVPLKSIADRAIEGLDVVRTVLVARRTDAEVPMRPGRDYWLDVEMQRQRSTCPVEWMASESPLFILYTSGSTGKPKGVLHTTGGYLTYAAATHRLVFDIRPDDVFFCTADVGWITGHSYLVYGPLANGTTTVLFEGVPTHPDPGRLWQLVDDLGVTVLYTAPTAIRTLAREGRGFVERYRRETLRVLGTVGEPISPDAWHWFHDVVGGGRCAVVDTYGDRDRRIDPPSLAAWPGSLGPLFEPPRDRGRRRRCWRNDVGQPV